MGTEEAATATDPSPVASPRGFYGCAIALIAVFTLIALGAYAVTELEKGLDGTPPHPGYRETAHFQLTLS
ncbi:hypothetical protein G3I55_35920 [Streptomyces sp. SID6648]|nr:hypothetical protein [Streptomyces sp. SID6648]